MFISGFLQVLQFYVKIWSKTRKASTSHLPLPDAPASRDSVSWETKEAHIPTADAGVKGGGFHEQAFCLQLG